MHLTPIRYSLLQGVFSFFFEEKDIQLYFVDATISALKIDVVIRRSAH